MPKNWVSKLLTMPKKNIKRCQSHWRKKHCSLIWTKSQIHNRVV